MGVVGLLLPVLTAAGGAVLLRPLSWAVLALAAYVLLVGEVVALVELLSLFTAVGRTSLLALELAVAVAVAVPLGVRIGLHDVRLPPRPRPPELRSRPALLVLAVGVGIALAYELALAVGTPPNNDDSLVYHLSRAAAWLQLDRVGYFAGHSQRENGSAPNAEILVLLTFVFTHGDRLAAVWQWLAGVATLVSIYVIGLRIRLTRAEAAFAALLFATLAQPVQQASTTQNDLVAASLVAATVAFLATAERRRYELAALALALALGTKLTVLFALPGVALVAATLVPRRHWARLAALGVVAFALVGSWGYVLNSWHTGRIQGSGAAVALWEQHSWLGRLGTAAHVSKELVARWSPTNQDLSWFGPLAAIALAPMIVLALHRAARERRPTVEAALALAVPLYVLCLAYAYRDNAWIGRYMIIPVALAAPLLGWVLRFRAYAAVTVAVGLATLGGGLLFSNGKPSGLGDRRSIWTMPRSEAMAIERPSMRAFIDGIETCVPPHAGLGYAIDEADWAYPLYGRDLSRVPVRLPAGDPVAAAEALGLRYVVLRNSYLRRAAPGWQQTALGTSNFSLLVFGPACELPPQG